MLLVRLHICWSRGSHQECRWRTIDIAMRVRQGHGHFWKQQTFQIISVELYAKPWEDVITYALQ